MTNEKPDIADGIYSIDMPFAKLNALELASPIMFKLHIEKHSPPSNIYINNICIF